MRYIHLKAPGGPENMVIREGAPPDPDSGDVLIRVAAAGVNRPDVLQRRGLYPPPSGASPVLGLEVAGEIAAVGRAVSEWAVGERVCALTNGGGYAEYVSVPAGQCLPVPAGLSLSEAAALPETFFTVWSNVFERGRLAPGEAFLVHGGSSGIGTTAIQMASAMGARVFATAGSAEKCRACESLGAERAVNYRKADFVAVIMAATAGKGADVILDMVGGDYVSRNLELAAVDGRIVNIAFLDASTVTVNLMPLLLKRITLTGSTLRPRSTRTKAAIADRLRSRIWPLIESGRIKPLIAERFPLADAPEAHRLMESSRHIGKIVLEVSG